MKVATLTAISVHHLRAIVRMYDSEAGAGYRAVTPGCRPTTG